MEAIIIDIQELIKLHNETINSELEVHIGKIQRRRDRNKFLSEVSEQWFYTQLKKMESFKKWEKCDEHWERIEELIFDRDVRLRRNPEGEGIFMKKIFIKGLDFSIPEAQYDVRLVLKAENEANFNFGVPKYFRFKERKTFTFGGFTYFFTKIWDGKTMDEVLEKRAKYEIEIEFDQCKITDINTCIASLLIKCRELVGKKEYMADDNFKRVQEFAEQVAEERERLYKKPKIAARNLNTQQEYIISKEPKKESEAPNFCVNKNLLATFATYE